MKLDPVRVAEARERAKQLLREAAVNERYAASQRRAAELLARTWGFDAGSLLDKPEPGA